MNVTSYKSNYKHETLTNNLLITTASNQQTQKIELITSRAFKFFNTALTMLKKM